VKLTVTDAAGSSASLTQNVTVTAGDSPAAVIVTSPSSPGQFEKVSFDGSRSTVATGRTITKYEWHFNDPNSNSDNPDTVTGAFTTHKFNVIGTYAVTLTVTDSAGLTNTATANVTVVNGVTASFTISPTQGARGITFVFDTEGSQGSDCGFGCRNQIVKYIWNFGDSTDLIEVTTRTTSHTYATSLPAGTYTVNLTVVDSVGRRATTTRTVIVS
jgi:PKD repeat protein